MAIKKSQIYSDLWESCDKLRGGMDASQYKDYILSILFVKYISDKYKNQKDSAITIPKGGTNNEDKKITRVATTGNMMSLTGTLSVKT